MARRKTGSRGKGRVTRASRLGESSRARVARKGKAKRVAISAVASQARRESRLGGNLNTKARRRNLTAQTNWFERNLRESLSYISNSRRFIYAGIYIFVASAVVGFAASPLLTFLDDFIRRIALKVAGLNTLELILFIFKNNLSSALMSIVLGAFLGIVPIMSAITNGVLVGYVLARALVIAGVASWWRLLPHGIFELPAIFIAIGLGMKLGFSIFEQDMSEAFKERFVNGLKTFVFIILPLLLIAAIIEGSLIKLL